MHKRGILYVGCVQVWNVSTYFLVISLSEEEDSHPYRIVELSTNVSYDSSGYAFLDAIKEEERPYQKLNYPSSSSEKKASINSSVFLVTLVSVNNIPE